MKKAAQQTEYLRSENDPLLLQELINRERYRYLTNLRFWSQPLSNSYFEQKIQKVREEIKTKIRASGQNIEDHEQIKNRYFDKLNRPKYYNRQDYYNMIPLMLFIKHAGFLENFDMILSIMSETNCNLQNLAGETPLHLAIENVQHLGDQAPTIIQLLISKTNCNLQNTAGETLLCLAIYYSQSLGNQTEAIFQSILLKTDLNTIDLRPGFINFFKQYNCTERQQKMILTLAKRSCQFIPEGAFEQPLLINNPALKVLLDRIIIGKERMATLIAGQRRLRERGYPQLPPELFEVIRDQFLDSSDQDSDNNPPATPLGP